MTHHHLRGVLLALLLATAVNADTLQWAATYNQALTRAREEGKLVILVLERDLCPYCARLEQETLQAEAVTEQGERFVGVRVNVVENRELATRYAKSSVPQTVFLTGQAQQVGKVGGYVPATVFTAHMQQAWAARDFPAEIVQRESTIAERPRDARALARLGRLYVATDQETKAEPILKRALEQAANLDEATAAGARLDLLIARLPAHDGELAPDFTAWLAQNPQHDRLIEAQYYTAYALALKGEGQKALDLWAKVTEKAPETPYGLLAAHYTTVVREAMQRRNGNGG